MKRVFFIILIMALILSMSCGICAAEPWDGTVAESYAKGDGTVANPYVIETPAQLALLSQKVNLTKAKGGSNYANCYFELANNIDFGCSVNEDGAVNGSVFTPIGTTDSLSFAGNFDGKGHTISGLVIQSAKADTAIEFFGYTGASGKEARILNLTLKDSTLLLFAKSSIPPLLRMAATQAEINSAVEALQ